MSWSGFKLKLLLLFFFLFFLNDVLKLSPYKTFIQQSFFINSKMNEIICNCQRRLKLHRDSENIKYRYYWNIFTIIFKNVPLSVCLSGYRLFWLMTYETTIYQIILWCNSSAKVVKVFTAYYIRFVRTWI
jgi:hypothetical protein